MRKVIRKYGGAAARPLGRSALLAELRGARAEARTAREELREERARIDEAVAARRLSEQALSGALLRLTLHVTDSPLAVIEWDPAGRVLFWSPGAERLFGWNASEVSTPAAGSFHDLLQDEREAAAVWSRLTAGRSPREVCVARARTREGRAVPCQWYLSAVHDVAGGVISVLAFGLDVSAQWDAEEALRRSESRYRHMLETAQEGVWMLDADAHVTYANWHLADMLGYSPQEMCGRPMADFLASDCAAPATDVRLRHRDGSDRWALVTMTPIMEADQCAGFLGMFADITERKRVAAWQRAFLRDVLSSVTQGRLLLCDAEADLPCPLEPLAGRPNMPVLSETLSGLRARIQAAATEAGLPPNRGDDLLLGAGEAAMNAVVHAGGGRAHVLRDPARGLVQVWLRDQGGGIALDHLHRATLEPGFTTAGTLGQGFYILLHTCDRVYLHTGPAGTTVVLEQAADGGDSVV